MGYTSSETQVHIPMYRYDMQWIEKHGCSSELRESLGISRYCSGCYRWGFLLGLIPSEDVCFAVAVAVLVLDGLGWAGVSRNIMLACYMFNPTSMLELGCGIIVDIYYTIRCWNMGCYCSDTVARRRKDSTA